MIRQRSGEDVVAGIRTPQRIEETLAKVMPQGHRELVEIGKKLEAHYHDVQDIEFTIQRGKVWMLQTVQCQANRLRRCSHCGRPGQRRSHLETRRLEGAKRIPADDLNQLLQPIYDPESRLRRRGCWPFFGQRHQCRSWRRLGQICFHASDAEQAWLKDNKVQLILGAAATSPRTCAA